MRRSGRKGPPSFDSDMPVATRIIAVKSWSIPGPRCWVADAWRKSLQSADWGRAPPAAGMCYLAVAVAACDYGRLARQGGGCLRFQARSAAVVRGVRGGEHPVLARTSQRRPLPDPQALLAS